MRNINNKHSAARSYFILLVITIISIIIIFLFQPIPQWLNYHQFDDVRYIWGIPNFWNVVSNIPFFLVGVLGFFAINREWQAGNFVNWQEVTPFLIIFLGLVLTAVGSSYYHLAPNNYTLVWDRIPMTFVFMSLLSLTIMERINFKVGFWLLLPLLMLGVGSVWYWIWTESLGRGDLRLYGFVQFYSIALVLVILYLFPKPFPSTKSYLLVIIFYGIARFFEYKDDQIYQMGGVISGHTLKHLFAAIGAYWFIVMVHELAQRSLVKK